MPRVLCFALSHFTTDLGSHTWQDSHLHLGLDPATFF